MPVVVRTLLILGTAAVVPLGVWLADVARRDSRPPVVAATTATSAPAPLRVASGCASATCHGGPAAASPSAESWRSSATVWHTSDPHTKAYAALSTELAARIMERLNGPEKDATKADRCLACHTNPAEPTGGMGCASCHGNPDRWLDPHRSFGTKNRVAEYDAAGMPKLFDLGVRAELCVGCHVGAPADRDRNLPLRDMNHDMIAAGHPRLNFDFGEYQRRLSPHWYEKDRTAADPYTPAGPGFEAKAWLVGRVAIAETACALLADRASRADPWPELAEMNCFGCHHEFEPKSWRVTAAKRTPARKPGAAAWQTLWPVTRPDDFARLNSDASHAVTEVVALMERTRSPNPTVAAAAARAAAAKLRAARDALARSGEKDAAGAARRVFEFFPPERADLLDWDEAGQVYYGLDALDRVRVKAGGAADRRLTKFAEVLRFPRTPDGDGFDSPRGYTPAAGRDLLRECLKSFPPPADVIER